jgi:hypothetical protein
MHRLGLLRENGSVTPLKSISAQFANEMDGISLNCFASIFDVLRNHRIPLAFENIPSKA